MAIDARVTIRPSWTIHTRSSRQVARNASIDELAAVARAILGCLDGGAAALEPGQADFVALGRARHVERAFRLRKRPIFHRVGRQLVNDQRQRRRGPLAHPHPLDRHPDPAAERAQIVIGGEQQRKEVAEQRRAALVAGQRADQIVARPSAVRRSSVARNVSRSSRTAR